MLNPLHASLSQLAEALAAREVSSVELTRFFLERIDRLDQRLNAFITVDPERALADARAADTRLAAGERGGLLGIPVAHKDIFCTRGMRTTCGSRMLENFISPYDAHVIEGFNRAGAVLLGKTNMDEFAMGSSSETSYFGPVRNPWKASAVPGGSSGGSAAAVAARMVPAATGTDTGGSIRQPAAMSGISGLKPTYGLVSRYGMIAYASSFDQGGPMARSAADLALLMNVMVGHDARDSTSLARPAEDYTRALEGAPGSALAGLRIGLPREYFGEGVDAGVAQRVREAVDLFERHGAKAVEVTLPNTRLSVPCYYVLAPAEASSNLSRFDGVRYGHRAAEYVDLRGMYANSRAEGFGEEVKRRILIGTWVLSHGYYDAYYVQAQKLRRLVARDFAAAFAQCDLILGPTTPTTAFELGVGSGDPVQMYLNDIFTLAANLAGLPGMSIPCGFDAAGLPVGLQLVGTHFSESRMLAAAHAYQQLSDWHQQLPGECA